MKIPRLTYYDEEILNELKKRNMNLGVVNNILRDFLGKNIENVDDLSKKKQIIDDFNAKKAKFEADFKYYSFIKRRKIDNNAQKWLKNYVFEHKDQKITKEMLENDIESYLRMRMLARHELGIARFKHDDLAKAIKKWDCLQKNQ